MPPLPFYGVPIQMVQPADTRNDDIAQQDIDNTRRLEANMTHVREALQSLRYGSISLTVHEGRIVQIDILEKRRMKPD